MLLRNSGANRVDLHEPSLQEGSTASGGAGSHRSIIQRPDGDAEPVHHLPPPQQQRPDGDMELVDGGRGFRVPPCSACGGILKPDVVFFGDGACMKKSGPCTSAGAGRFRAAIWRILALQHA